MKLLIYNKRYVLKIIDIEALLTVLMWAIFFEFPLYNFLPQLVITSINFIKILCLIFLIIWYVLHSTNNNYGIFEVAMLTFLLWGGLLCAIHKAGNYYHYIKECFYPFIMVFLLFNFIFHNDAFTKIRYISKYYIFAIWLNAFLMILFPHGIVSSSYNAITERSVWIFGSKNIVTSFIPMMLLVMLVAYSTERSVWQKKILYPITIIAFFISVIFMGSTGIGFMQGASVGIVMITVFIIFVLFIHRRFFSNIVNQSYIFGVIITILLMALVVSISKGTIVNDVFIFDILGKDTGFSGRYSVWKEVLYVIKNHFLFGIGFNPVKYHIYGSSVTTFSTYSFWLQILSTQGIIGFCFVIFLFFASSQPKIKDKRCAYFILAIYLLLVRGLQNTLTWNDIIALLYFFVLFKRYVIYNERNAES